MKYLYVCILFIMASAFLLFSSPEESREKMTLRTGSSLEGARIVQKKNGAEEWTMTARRADFTENDSVALLHTVSIEAPAHELHVDAGSGIYNLTTKHLELKEDIRIRIKSGVVTASTVDWDPATGLLTSGGRVRLEGHRFAVEGRKLTATQDQKIHIAQDVKATFF